MNEIIEHEDELGFGKTELAFIIEAVNMKETITNNINSTLLLKYKFLTDIITREIKNIETSEINIDWTEVMIIANAVFFLGNLTPSAGSFASMDITPNMQQAINQLARKIYFAIPFSELIEFKTESDFASYATSLINKNQKPPQITSNDFNLDELSAEQISSLRSSLEIINSQGVKLN